MGTDSEAGALLIVLSGPSGVGKDAVVSRIRDRGRPYRIAVTATTRPRRPSETDGVDYIFVDETSFERMVSEDQFLEWAEVYGNRYGVPKAQVADALEGGTDVIVKTDVQGAATIRMLLPEAVFIFLAPPDMGSLEDRLKQRMTESQHALRLRLATAKAEMEQAASFDRVVVNRDGRIDDTVAEIESIVAVEKRRRPARNIAL